MTIEHEHKRIILEEELRTLNAKKPTLKIHTVEAITLPDLWFQAVYGILDHGKRHTIDCGSFEGHTRLEYDYFIGHVVRPYDKPILPEIPEHLNIPAPVTPEYLYGGENYSRSYIEYLMTKTLAEGESYTYGQRLVEGDVNSPFDQIQHIIATYKKYGYRNNQMILQVGQPSDMKLQDPPCLRHIDTRIQDNRLHFFVYFRSWDLWSGLPANLAAIQTLKEYMALEIGVEDGEMIVESKGLHIYGHSEELAKIRTNKS